MAAAPPPHLVERFRRDLAALAGAPPALAVAVSGGPDSLALLLLAAAAFPGQIRAATVDHRLRPESADEAEAVAAICAGLGVPHRILLVAVAPAGEGLQAAARKARYRAVARWMELESVGLLLTGHHADDQAETLLMRLMRGSGAAGLAGIRPFGPVPGEAGPLRLCRPLLSWRRAELGDIVRAAGLEAAQDPSNGDERFDRPIVRRHLARMEWFDPVAAARSAALLAEADEALDWAAESLAASRIAGEEGALILKPEGLPAELRRRLVLECLRRLAPGARPRGEKLAALIGRLEEGGTATLAGVKAMGGEAWRFEPAPPRRR
jgi:tRNA(Ile)-lysidine synthase